MNPRSCAIWQRNRRLRADAPVCAGCRAERRWAAVSGRPSGSAAHWRQRRRSLAEPGGVCDVRLSRGWKRPGVESARQQRRCNRTSVSQPATGGRLLAVALAAADPPPSPSSRHGAHPSARRFSPFPFLLSSWLRGLLLCCLRVCAAGGGRFEWIGSSARDWAERPFGPSVQPAARPAALPFTTPTHAQPQHALPQTSLEHAAAGHSRMQFHGDGRRRRRSRKLTAADQPVAAGRAALLAKSEEPRPPEPHSQWRYWQQVRAVRLVLVQIRTAAQRREQRPLSTSDRHRPAAFPLRLADFPQLTDL